MHNTANHDILHILVIHMSADNNTTIKRLEKENEALRNLYVALQNYNQVLKESNTMLRVERKRYEIINQ